MRLALRIFSHRRRRSRGIAAGQTGFTSTEGKFGPDLYTDFLIDFMERSGDTPFFAYYSMALCHDVTDDIKKPVPFYKDGRWMSFAEMAIDQKMLECPMSPTPRMSPPSTPTSTKPCDRRFRF